MSCQQFEAFTARFGDDAAIEILERIADAQWNGRGEGVKFSYIHQHDACNHVLSGSIEHAGETFHFIIESGNRNGTEIIQFGGPDDVGVYEPPEPSRFMFVPQNDHLKEERPEMWKVYLRWTKEKWFVEKLGAYHYDRHFQPGHSVETHYKNWAASKGLKIVSAVEASV